MSDVPPQAALPEAEPIPMREGLSRRQKKRRRPRWRRYLTRGLVALLAVIVALGGAEAGYLAFVNHQIHRIKVSHLTHLPQTGPHLAVGAQTFLLIGSTSRCVLNNKQTEAFGSCASGVTGVNSDVIILLRA